MRDTERLPLDRVNPPTARPMNGSQCIAWGHVKGPNRVGQQDVACRCTSRLPDDHDYPAVRQGLARRRVSGAVDGTDCHHVSGARPCACKVQVRRAADGAGRASWRGHHGQRRPPSVTWRRCGGGSAVRRPGVARQRAASGAEQRYLAANDLERVVDTYRLDQQTGSTVVSTAASQEALRSGTGTAGCAAQLPWPGGRDPRQGVAVSQFQPGGLSGSGSAGKLITPNGPTGRAGSGVALTVARGFLHPNPAPARSRPHGNLSGHNQVAPPAQARTGPRRASA
jgi:hypothetical protein